MNFNVSHGILHEVTEFIPGPVFILKIVFNFLNIDSDTAQSNIPKLTECQSCILWDDEWNFMQQFLIKFLYLSGLVSLFDE